MPLDADLSPGIDGGRYTAEGHALVKSDIILDVGRLADHHALTVIDDEAAADGRTRMDLDSRRQPTQM